MTETRIPTQKRSIEKRARIIEKGFELMCENGFYQTNTAEIAKYAGVSTGIVYQYFKDKKEIFLEGVQNYANQIMYPMLTIFESPHILDDLSSKLSEMIDQFVQAHTISKKAHEELLAMSHLDDDVAEIFKTSELIMTEKIAQILEENQIDVSYIREKVHVLISMVDHFCHEMVYHQHVELNYSAMKEYVIHLICLTFEI